MQGISCSLVGAVQTLATNTITKDGQQMRLDEESQGYAFVTLGKLCLQSTSCANTCVDLLVLHLSASDSVVVRNNILMVMGDLCEKYPSLVDSLIPCMTSILADPIELLRKQAAMILGSLLSNELIKFRGFIKQRFIQLLGDPSDSVRQFVESLFTRILHRRFPAVFLQNFVETIAVLNGWHGLHGNQTATLENRNCVSHPHAQRVKVYYFMLSSMSSDQKFGVCAQLVTTLLASFVDADSGVALPQTADEPAGQVLSDALAILSCREMRVCYTAPATCQETHLCDDDDDSVPEAASNILGSALRRNLCENIVPVLAQVKVVLEKNRSPLLGRLRRCLVQLLGHMSDDLHTACAGDSQLAQEVAFDMRSHRGSTFGHGWAPLTDLMSSREVSVGNGAYHDTASTGESLPISSAAGTSTRKLKSLPRARGASEISISGASDNLEPPAKRARDEESTCKHVGVGTHN